MTGCKRACMEQRVAHLQLDSFAEASGRRNGAIPLHPILHNMYSGHRLLFSHQRLFIERSGEKLMILVPGSQLRLESHVCIVESALFRMQARNVLVSVGYVSLHLLNTAEGIVKLIA